MIERLLIKNKYGVVPNTVLADNSLSLRAKGLYAYLNSKPHNWQFRLDRVESTDGIQAVRSAMNELIERGYVERRKIYDEKHRFRGYIYILKEHPGETVAENEIIEAINSPAVQDETEMLENPSSENKMLENPSSKNKMSENPSSKNKMSENPSSEKPTSENRRSEMGGSPLATNGKPDRYKNGYNKTDNKKEKIFNNKGKTKNEEDNIIDLQTLKQELSLAGWHLNVNKRIGDMVALGEFYEAVPPAVEKLLKELGLNRNLTKFDREQLFKLRDLAGGWENVESYLKKCVELRPRFGFLMGFDWQILLKKYDFIVSYEPAPTVDFSKFETPKAWLKYCVNNISDRWVRKLTFDWYFHWRFTDLTMQDVERLVQKILELKKQVEIQK
jgi:hypothetical protein